MQHRLVTALAGLGLALAAAACGATPASPGVTLSPSASPFASTATGDYRLGLALTRLAWRVGDPMSGTATLVYGGTGSRVLYGSGSGLIAFDYVEVGGTRRLEGVSTADCAPHDISPAAPITAPLAKGGGYSPDNPADAWIKAVMDADGVQLPAGTWDVSARATFFEDACGGASYSMVTTVRVLVGG